MENFLLYSDIRVIHTLYAVINFRARVLITKIIVLVVSVPLYLNEGNLVLAHADKKVVPQINILNFLFVRSFPACVFPSVKPTVIYSVDCVS